MRLIFGLCVAAAMFASLTGCIKSEPLNAECDILEATLPGNVLNREPDVRNAAVIFTVKQGTDVTALAPEFMLTPGASIVPPGGTVRDFSSPQTYTVTSEDGEWHKEYTVSVIGSNSGQDADLYYQYNFDKVRVHKGLGSSYDVFYEVGADGEETMAWATGNPGFALSGKGSTPETFPTSQADNGSGGKCVKLVTMSTGTFGAGVGKPMAAGSIFLGKFNTSVAVMQPLKATQFGISFYAVPQVFSGTYKYTPGPVYYEAGTGGKLAPVEGKKDECNIYAVFFEAVEGHEWLDGTNVLSDDNPNIIAVARLAPEQRTATGGWVEFTLPFIYRDGKSVDVQKLAAGRYSLAVVASSSMDGDFFCGALESCLMVDKLQLVCTAK